MIGRWVGVSNLRLEISRRNFEEGEEVSRLESEKDSEYLRIPRSHEEIKKLRKYVIIQDKSALTIYWDNYSKTRSKLLGEIASKRNRFFSKFIFNCNLRGHERYKINNARKKTGNSSREIVFLVDSEDDFRNVIRTVIVVRYCITCITYMVVYRA